MKYIEFDIKGMNISRTNGDKTALISGAVNYFGIHFNADAEFTSLAGVKYCEFYKNKSTKRVELVENACAIPNDFLKDKTPFEIRVISGNMIATPWAVVSITESGVITPDEPEEEAPENTSYVKTPTGENAIAFIRGGENGMEYSSDGENWENGVNGIPDVPRGGEDVSYVRKNVDWVPLQIPEQTNVEGLSGTAVTLAELDESATLEEVVAKVNEIIGILKDRGVTTV